MGFEYENFEKQPNTVEQFPSIDDPEEAQEYILNLFEQGERPIVSIPKEYAHYLQEGLAEQASWIPELKIITGTFGRDPYNPDAEERLFARVSNITPEQIHPRFTGPDTKFHGVVIINGPIPPDAIEVL